MMGHENSITVKRGGRWFNLDNSGVNKGGVLGSKRGFATQKNAVAAAKGRSARGAGPGTKRARGEKKRLGK